MEATATCAFCGARAAPSEMEITGLGSRCLACSDRAPATADMATHLTRRELDAVVRSSNRQIRIGLGLALAGLTAMAVLVAIDLSIFAAFLNVFGVGAIGIGALIGHGRWRRRQATAAIDRSPDARVVRLPGERR